jgi:hypothetical protein
LRQTTQKRDEGNIVTRQRAADDFAAIRARMDELRGDPGPAPADSGCDAHSAATHPGARTCATTGMPRSALVTESTSEEIITEVRELIRDEPNSIVIWATDLRPVFARWNVTKIWTLSDLCTRIELSSKLPKAIEKEYHGVHSGTLVQIVGEADRWDCLRESIKSCCHASCKVVALDEVVYGQVARDYEPPDLILTTKDIVAYVDADAKFRYDRYKQTVISPLLNLKPPPRVVAVESLWENQSLVGNEFSRVGRDRSPMFQKLRVIDDFLLGLKGPPSLVLLAC